ncbi:MAG: QueT transporter family protein [Candidatus Bathyarchaeia archaeon]
MNLKLSSKDVALTIVFAALYAALVYINIPLSFSAFQFRVAGVLRPAIGKKWVLAFGYAIGVVAANVFSPFGAWDLLFMPVVSFFAGLAGYVAAKKFSGNYFITGAVIAFIVPLCLSWMLNVTQGAPMIATFPYLLVSEQVICLIGALIFRAIDIRFKWWK